MDGELQVRIGANEATFRAVNEGISRGHYPGEDDVPRGFRCECARLGCNKIVELSARDYERIRANSRRFFVVPGHERSEFERVVERHDRYVVVEKIGKAARRAEASDPRR